MFFRVTRITEDIFCLELGEDFVFQTLFLGHKEIELLRDVLREAEGLSDAKFSERWYNG